MVHAQQAFRASELVGDDARLETLPPIATTPWYATLVLPVLAAAVGCTSPLTGLALKEFLRESTASVRADYEAAKDDKTLGDEPVETITVEDDEADGDEGPAAAEATGRRSDGTDAAGGGAVIEAAGGAAAARGRAIEEAISRSLERFARAPGADSTAQGLLVDALEKAPRDDWPEIIDSFSLSLENASVDSPKSATGDKPSVTGGLTMPVDSKAAARSAEDRSASEESPRTADAKKPSGSGEPEPATESVATVDSERPSGGTGEPEPAAEPAAPETAASPESIVASLRRELAEARRRAPLVIENPCFASRVRGWAAVDRFPAARFSPGQQVIVYIELENLVADEDSAGAMTRIDTAFRLLDGSGGLIHEWAFPTVEDRSASPRTDFFARYFLTMPESAVAGTHRLEMVVSDRVAGKDAASHLDLEIVPPGG